MVFPVVALVFDFYEFSEGVQNPNWSWIDQYQSISINLLVFIGIDCLIDFPI
jgi:hypothetical protein